MQVQLTQDWTATTSYGRIKMSGTALFDGKSAPIQVYRFPADVTQIHADLPTWPSQNTVLDFIGMLFCDL